MHASFVRPSFLVAYRTSSIYTITRCMEERMANSVIRQINDDDYKPQLEAKKAKVEALFSEYSTPALEVFESKPRHYRMRSEFTVWHQDSDMYYVMHEKSPEPGGKSIKVRVDQYPVASVLVNTLMLSIRAHVLGNEMLKHKLFQVNFHTTLNGEAMVTMLYHKKLDDRWTELAKALKEEVSKECRSELKNLHIIGRSRKQKICLDADYVEEVYEVDGRGTLRSIQVEGAFSQPNACTCGSMLSWAVSATKGSQDHDLLELYCGNGNFTTAVAPNFRKVIATEVSSSAVAAAKKNFEKNGISNVFVARMRSEEFTDGWKKGTEYKRLEGSGLRECDFKTLLVDPPRAGLDPETQKLMKDFDTIVYISCNPETLKRDYETAADEYSIERFAMFDQFPYTNHVECGLLLRRRTAKRQKIE